MPSESEIADLQAVLDADLARERSARLKRYSQTPGLFTYVFGCLAGACGPMAMDLATNSASPLFGMPVAQVVFFVGVALTVLLPVTAIAMAIAYLLDRDLPRLRVFAVAGTITMGVVSVLV
jgi:hypothetical protein